MISSTALYKNAQTSIAYQNTVSKVGLNKRALTTDKPRIDKIFLPYQEKWIQDRTPLVWCAKGRRTGLTFAESYRASVDASRGNCNTFYTSYNYHACKAFIQKCGIWAKMFSKGFQFLTDQVLIDNQSISVFKIVFNNGFFIEALPGNPENLRDKQGVILIDEGAFRHDLEAILDAAMAVGVWGGQVKVWSTHNGETHYFNTMTKKILEDSSLGSYHFIPFKDAIRQGLYQKICQMTGKVWTPQDEIAFIESLYHRYGDGAVEELDAIPRKYGSNQIFKEEYFQEIELHDYEVESCAKIRYWDIATSTKTDSYYTATVLIGMVRDRLVILECDAEKLDAAEGDEFIRKTAMDDSTSTIILIEQEPGASGVKYVEYMKTKMIPNRYVEGYAPTANKLARALPVVPELKKRNIMVRKGMINKERFISAVCAFDGTPRPLTNDWTDCLSGIVDYAQGNFPDWIAD